MKRITVFVYCILIITGFACKESYNPPIISSADSYLVVEGVLNASADSTTIRLTRSYKLGDEGQLKGEKDAQVVVEGKDNSTRQLTMTSDGTYVSSNLNLVLNQEYRLRITTSNGKEYLSDYVIAQKTPLIDSLGFKQEDKGVQVYVNAHDDSNNTRYYRWDYDETWEINSFYNTGYIYENDIVRFRGPTEKVYYCWKYGSSTSIVINSTASLESDILYRAPITFKPNGDEKLAVRYSIMLRQYALDKKGYEFYEMMKKNTEQIGTIFDPQPSETKGNMHCVSNPDELVIGYISACTIEKQRYFIAVSQLDRWRYEQDCPPELVMNHPDSIREAYAGGGSIYGAIYDRAGSFVTYYNFSSIECVECPKRGGSLIRPSYW